MSKEKKKSNGKEDMPQQQSEIYKDTTIKSTTTINKKKQEGVFKRTTRRIITNHSDLENQKLAAEAIFDVLTTKFNTDWLTVVNKALDRMEELIKAVAEENGLPFVSRNDQNRANFLFKYSECDQSHEVVKELKKNYNPHLLDHLTLSNAAGATGKVLHPLGAAGACQQQIGSVKQWITDAEKETDKKKSDQLLFRTVVDMHNATIEYKNIQLYSLNPALTAHKNVKQAPRKKGKIGKSRAAVLAAIKSDVTKENLLSWLEANKYIERGSIDESTKTAILDKSGKKVSFDRIYRLFNEESK